MLAVGGSINSYIAISIYLGDSFDYQWRVEYSSSGYYFIDIAFSNDGNKIAFMSALANDFSSYTSATLIVLNSDTGVQLNYRYFPAYVSGHYLYSQITYRLKNLKMKKLIYSGNDEIVTSIAYVDLYRSDCDSSSSYCYYLSYK